MNECDCRAEIINRNRVEGPINIRFPEVRGLERREVQEQINSLILRIVEKLIQKQMQIFPGLTLEEMLGTYEVTLNNYCLLSIYFENFAYFRLTAHGVTLSDSFTANLQTGQVYDLKDLFKPGSQYRVTINRYIEKLIAQQDLPTVSAFPGISDYQQFYLTEKDLVIYFQAVEFTPSFVGIPKFSIPLSYLKDLVREDSPIKRILECQRILSNSK